MSTVAENLLTAEEFARLPDNGVPMELVRGRVVVLNVPEPRHGQICSTLARCIGNHADEHALGHVVINNSGVITKRNPDTVRGRTWGSTATPGCRRGRCRAATSAWFLNWCSRCAPRGDLKVPVKRFFE